MNDFIKNLERILEDAGPAADAISFWAGALGACRTARKEGLLDKAIAQDHERLILEKLENIGGTNDEKDNE